MTNITFCFGIIICFLEPPVIEVPVNNFGQECRVLTLSKKDTVETQRQVARENARCRAARETKK